MERIGACFCLCRLRSALQQLPRHAQNGARKKHAQLLCAVAHTTATANGTTRWGKQQPRYAAKAPAQALATGLPLYGSEEAMNPLFDSKVAKFCVSDCIRNHFPSQRLQRGKRVPTQDFFKRAGKLFTAIPGGLAPKHAPP